MVKDSTPKSTEKTTLTGTSIWNWLKLQWENRFNFDIKFTHKYLLVWFIILISTPAIWWEKIVYGL